MELKAAFKTGEILVNFTLIALISGLLISCTDNKSSSMSSMTDEMPTKVRIGLAFQPSGSLFFVAEEKGFFKKQNLDLVITNYPSGKRALKNGLLKGKEDLITTTEVPFVFSSFTETDLKVISTIFVADNVNSVIARRDSGIKTPADLKGKRVATQKSSAVHYFLHLFMLENHIKDEDVATSYMKAENLPAAISSGSIDAFSMREPYISEAKKLLGDNAIVFKEPGIYNQVELLISNDDFIKSHPKVISRILKALLEAEEFTRTNSVEADTIVSTKFSTTIEAAAAFRSEMQQRIALDQSMLLLLEGIGRWAIDNEMVGTKELPDYLNYIHYSGLREIDSKSVTIVH